MHGVGIPSYAADSTTVDLPLDELLSKAATTDAIVVDADSGKIYNEVPERELWEKIDDGYIYVRKDAVISSSLHHCFMVMK